MFVCDLNINALPIYSLQASIIGILGRLDGEHDIIGGYGSAVMPLCVFLQIYSVIQTITGYFIGLGKVRNKLSFPVVFHQTGIDQTDQIAVNVIVLGQERIYVMRFADHSFAERTAVIRHGFGVVIKNSERQ